eukprot:Nitzschia sp. Nitz4//scaffold122_size67431//3874//4860//NITZ4_006080-RA/size67431-augustus-gene-0.55-mRNA-1//-1//CDS//3329534388//111//frame0
MNPQATRMGETPQNSTAPSFQGKVSWWKGIDGANNAFGLRPPGLLAKGPNLAMMDESQLQSLTGGRSAGSKPMDGPLRLWQPLDYDDTIPLPIQQNNTTVHNFANANPVDIHQRAATAELLQNQFAPDPIVLSKGNDDDKLNQESTARFRSHQAENWMEKYEELLDFRLKNGHCLVPNAFKENPSLAEWVKRQRYQFKLRRLGRHSTMSNDRIAALEKLGFVWNSHDQVWEERLKELKAYNLAFGNCEVPSNYPANPQLAIWVKRQRRQYKFFAEGKPSTMSSYRIETLERLGFTWCARKSKSSP